MIAGAILLFIIAIELLTYGEWRFASNVKGEAGVVPIAFPLLAGPGAIRNLCNCMITQIKKNLLHIHYKILLNSFSISTISL